MVKANSYFPSALGNGDFCFSGDVKSASSQVGFCSFVGSIFFLSVCF